MSETFIERADTGANMGGSPGGPQKSRRGVAQLRLSGDFGLVVAGSQVALPHSLERVLAYLALRDARFRAHESREPSGLMSPKVAQSATFGRRYGASIVSILGSSLALKGD